MNKDRVKEKARARHIDRHRDAHVCTHGINKNTGLEVIIKMQKYVCIVKTKIKTPKLTLRDKEHT